MASTLRRSPLKVITILALMSSLATILAACRSSNNSHLSAGLDSSAVQQAASFLRTVESGALAIDVAMPTGGRVHLTVTFDGANMDIRQDSPPVERPTPDESVVFDGSLFERFGDRWSKTTGNSDELIGSLTFALPPRVADLLSVPCKTVVDGAVDFAVDVDIGSGCTVRLSGSVTPRGVESWQYQPATGDSPGLLMSVSLTSVNTSVAIEQPEVLDGL